VLRFIVCSFCSGCDVGFLAVHVVAAAMGPALTREGGLLRARFALALVARVRVKSDFCALGHDCVTKEIDCVASVVIMA
jgi:hypothetical protein